MIVFLTVEDIQAFSRQLNYFPLRWLICCNKKRKQKKTEKKPRPCENASNKNTMLTLTTQDASVVGPLKFHAVSLILLLMHATFLTNINSCLDGGRIAQWLYSASGFQSEDLGFDPPTGLGEGQFVCPSESTLVHACLFLNPLRLYGMHPNLSAR